jgi:hypothetical protein
LRVAGKFLLEQIDVPVPTPAPLTITAVEFIDLSQTDGLLPSNIPAQNVINHKSEYSHTTDMKAKKRASTADEHYNSDSNGPSSSKKVRNDSVEISTTGSTGTPNDDVIMKDT